MKSKQRKYGFLTLLVPQQLEKIVTELSKGNMQDAANALQWHIYDGLCKNLSQEIQLFNVLPVGSFPQYYRKAFISRCTFLTRYCVNNINIGFCNVKLLRKYFIPNKVYSTLHKWCEENDASKTLFVYTITPPFIKALQKLKKEFPQLQICSIVADLPDMACLTTKKNFLLKLFTKHQAAYTYQNLDCIDDFVLLSKHMADYMKIHQPFCVMEGISTNIKSEYAVSSEDEIIKILYSGTLHKKYGILNLVEAFQAIPNQNYRLIICGIGDSIEQIATATKQDKRILFKGQLPRLEVLKLQTQADVMVNPRQNNEEFTKYSFPSKNLEYLSTGKPLVAYKLDGIPDEYDNYIFYVKDNSVEALKYTLMAVCENTDGTVKEKAEQARKFVLEQKNEVMQTKKICQLIAEKG